MDYKEIKRKEVLFEIIDDVTNGMDIYNHNGSLWIINTKELKWVVEFTNDKTLWYNYNLFKNLFKAISLDVSENQKYITEWFESRFLNVYTVKTTVDPFFDQDQYVEDTIQNGVKDTKEFKWLQIDDVEDTIQNGVKETTPSGYLGSIEMKGKLVHQIESPKQNNEVEDTIQNGVKYTKNQKLNDLSVVEDTIQNGIKDTKSMGGKRGGRVGNTIENGVKDTKTSMSYQTFSVEDTIQNGVKHTEKSLQIDGSCVIEDTIQNGVKHTDCYDGRRSTKVEDTIQNGVKETKRALLPRNIKAINVIKNGVKHTEDGDWLDGDERIEDIIQEGVKETIPTLRRTLLGVDDIVQNGVKETHEDTYHHKGRIGGVIKNGVKEVQPLPAQDGNMDWGNYYHGKEDRTKPFNAYLNDTIKYGKKL